VQRCQLASRFPSMMPTSTFLWIGLEDRSANTRDLESTVPDRQIRRHVQRWSRLRRSTRRVGNGSNHEVEARRALAFRLRLATSSTITSQGAKNCSTVSLPETSPDGEGEFGSDSTARMSIITASTIQQPHPEAADDESNLAIRASNRQMVLGRGSTDQGIGTTSTLSKSEKVELPQGEKWCGQDRYSREGFQAQIEATMRFWHGICPKMSATLYTDKLEKMILTHHMTLSSVCSMKVAAQSPREPQHKVFEFNRLMTRGCALLQSGKPKEAFDLFDRGFACLRDILILQNIQGQPMLCHLIAQFQGPLFQPLWTRVYQYIVDLAAVLAGPNNPFGQSAKLFARSPIPLVDAAEKVLSCIFDVLQTHLGPLHPDTLDTLESVAWFHVERNRLSEAASRFKYLILSREASNGPFAVETCEAIRGLSETYLRLGELDIAESKYDELLGWRTLQSTDQNMVTIRIKCLLSLSLLSEQRQNWYRARWLLDQARQASVASFGVEGEIESTIQGRIMLLEVRSRRSQLVGQAYDAALQN
jgi:hypothetical protein